MNYAELMSPAELRALADKKEKESQPVKTGKLNTDLYSFDFKIPKPEMDLGFYTAKEKREIIRNVSLAFEPVARKGKIFTCIF